MIAWLRSLFARTEPQEEASRPPSPEELRVAACALLLEVAYADDDFVPNERQHLAEVVRRHFRLKPDDAHELISAAEDERRESVDLWAFTALVREHYSVGQKMVLAEAMWGLVLADGQIENREDWVMRKISGLLGLKAGYLSEARRRQELRARRPDGAAESGGAAAGGENGDRKDGAVAAKVAGGSRTIASGEEDSVAGQPSRRAPNA